MRTKTGIDGLDAIMGGGIIPGTNVLIEGAPGTGKTTFGLQFLYRGARDYGEPGVLFTFEEQPEQMYRDALGFGWDLRKLEKENKLRVVCTSPELVRGNIADTLDEYFNQIGAKRIVVDCITHFQGMATESARLREIIFQVISGFRARRLTAFLIREKGETEAFGNSFEEFLADTVIHLTYETSKWQERLRYMEILKSRGHSSLSGKHRFSICPEGIVIFPSPAVIEAISKSEFPPRVKTGVPGLDKMLGGGFFEGTCTIVAGAPGTGRTLFCLQFLWEGVKKGEPALFISFHEQAHKVYAAAHSFGMIDTPAQKDLFAVWYFPPAGLDANKLFSLIDANIQERGIRRLAIDSLTNLEYAIHSPSLLGQYLYGLSGLFQAKRITSLMTYGELGWGEERDFQHFHLPMVIENAILLSRSLVGGQSKRYLTVLKARMSSHEEEPEEFVIGERGMVICR